MKTQSTYIASTSQLKAVADGVFGARLELVMCGLPESKSYALWKDITRMLTSLEKVFDLSAPDSEVSVLNASKVDIETSDEMKSALNLCESYFVKTKELFNVSRHDSLDFSGFVKAYAVQKLATMLKKGKVKDAFVNFADSVIYAVGHKPYCDNWPYALESASGDELQEFDLCNECLAVSQFESRLCCVRSKDPLEAKVLSLVLPVATEAQRREMSYNFKSLSDSYFEV